MKWGKQIKLTIPWRLKKNLTRSTSIEVLFLEETTKTIRVNYKDHIVWLQKSLLVVETYEGDNITIIIPLWLFKLKFNGLKFPDE